MKTLLVTGCSGFVGSSFIEHIKNSNQNKYDIVLLSSKNHPDCTCIIHNNHVFNKEDFTKTGIEKVDIVLHIGAFIPKSGKDVNNIADSNSNISNTWLLLNNLPNIPEKIIYLSTIDVYAPTSGVINESSPLSPKTMYGWSKLYSEKMLQTWSKNNNCLLQILRIGHVYGKGEGAYKKLIPVTIENLRNGNNPVIYGSGKEKRSLLNIEDLCKYLISSLELDEEYSPINICSRTSFTVKELVEMLIEVSGEDVDIEYIDKDIRGVDYIFDTTLLDKILGKETINIKDGLKNEFYSQEHKR